MAESTRIALEKYLKKHLKQSYGPKRKNSKPEKEVEFQVLEWCRNHNFSVNVVESKAVYSHKAGRYLSGQTVSGFPDIVGNDIRGLAIYIELKAPGRRGTIRPQQLKFLREKILTGCFAVCVDSASSLDKLWEQFGLMSSVDRKAMLMKDLP